MTGQNTILFGEFVSYVGIIKEIDNLGRIVIPKEMRELLGLEKTVEVIVTRAGVLIRSPEYVLVKKEQK